MKSAPPLPEDWLERMRALLGDEFAPFIASYEDSPTAGLRVNTLKLAPDALTALVPWPLTPIPWCPAGFTLPDDLRPGRHPLHAAGLFYLQEPSAMAVAEALDVEPGMHVLDLAASPGGKATHLASLLAGQGLLVANEIVSSRIKALGENIERWGARNAVITNDDPHRLADALGARFDRVLLDAPCSGEGMFRKSPAARAEWSRAHVRGSAERQLHILDAAARLVRPGGRLVYSTCTFAPEENEAVIVEFLAAHPGWEVRDVPRSGGIGPARPDWAEPVDPRLVRAARLWPHRLTGEGHFIALLERSADAPDVREGGGDGSSGSRLVAPSRDTLASWRAFAADALTVSFPEERLLQQGEMLLLLPESPLDANGVRVVRPGVWLGEAKPGRFEPAHALALTLRAADATRTLDLDEPTARAYLTGQPIPTTRPDGWTLVTTSGHPLGWAKAVKGQAKNHYPKGLRH